MTAPTGATGGLLAVHAHPDDETLATGGLLAVWSAEGRPVTLVTCTRGELGEVIPPALAHLEGDGPALAERRERELAAAMGRLGVRDHLFLDAVPPGASGGSSAPGIPGTSGTRYGDSGMAWAGTGRAARAATLPPDAFVAVPLDDAAARLARVLRERRPDVVVTYEPNGGYGHPDHVRAHAVTMRAVALAAAEPPPAGADGDAAPAHRVPVVLWAVAAADALRRAYAGLAGASWADALRREDPRLTLPDPDGPLPSVAVDAADVSLLVDVTGVLDRVAAALGEHRTQVASVVVRRPDDAPAGARGPGDPRLAGCYALSNHVLAPLLTHEAYRVAPGHDAAGVVWPPSVTRVA